MLAGLIFSIFAPATVHAGGYDTGERDWDAVFADQRMATEAQVRYINPQRELRNIANTVLPGTAASNPETASFSIYRAGVAGRLSEDVRCLASFRQPFAGFADYGSTWIGSASAIEQNFISEDYGLTCAYSQPMGNGYFSLLGGVSYQTIEYELTSNGGLGGLRRTLVSDEAFAWRAGIAYELPQYALRASLIYNSQIDYEMAGSVSLSNVPGATAVSGDISMPQSLEFKAQSGVAPGWLAFGSVKWTDWSVTDNMPLCASGVANCTMATATSALTLLWDDTWTVTLGAVHQFSEQFSVAANLTWDQGATQGFTSQTDTWTAGLTGIYQAGERARFTLGATYGLLEGGSLSTAILPGGIVNPVGYTASFGDDAVYSLTAGFLLEF